jgi:hypothetical protein
VPHRIPLPPTGDELRAVVTSSLALTAEAVGSLDAYPGLLDPEKLVGEALLLLRATRTEADTSEWQTLYDATAPRARAAVLAPRICRDPGRALELAFTHVQLSDLGDRDPAVDVLLDLALAEEATGPGPYVVTELQRPWLRDVRREQPDETAWRRLLRGSSLAHPIDLLRCSTQDVYDLTHAVMHGTDLGLWPLTSPRDPVELAEDLDALLGIALDAENLDLTTELLWAWPMLRLPWTAAAGVALDTVIERHARLGYLPGPGLDPTGGPDRTQVLGTSYHATLVLGILAAALLRAGELPTADDGGLDAMHLAVALRRASDDADIAEVHRLLGQAVESGLTQGRAVVQATALLRRVTALVLQDASAERRTISACTG